MYHSERFGRLDVKSKPLDRPELSKGMIGSNMSPIIDTLTEANRT